MKLYNNRREWSSIHFIGMNRRLAKSRLFMVNIVSGMLERRRTPKGYAALVAYVQTLLKPRTIHYTWLFRLRKTTTSFTPLTQITQRFSHWRNILRHGSRKHFSKVIFHINFTMQILFKIAWLDDWYTRAYRFPTIFRIENNIYYNFLKGDKIAFLYQMTSWLIEQVTYRVMPLV